ncbi:hypothetical protein RFI_30231 [Reticulomyxa filosa]|uniref:Uncharacterized protein n=1 Tax=Reticulomyxa filosa TaxID=46433 RepID=X6M163_RETFI|nr:hypothetical protein RFI_30231 [Reticulomyxa filosa]|eukprot:ETO07162.1 hypothetical protein RFI_30231 [Reticulomyxa filosa]
MKDDLPKLYQSDAMFDNWKVCCSHKSNTLCSGSYDNSMVVVDWSSDDVVQLQQCFLDRRYIGVSPYETRNKKNQREKLKQQKLEQRMQRIKKDKKTTDKNKDKEDEKNKKLNTTDSNERKVVDDLDASSLASGFVNVDVQKDTDLHNDKENETKEDDTTPLWLKQSLCRSRRPFKNTAISHVLWHPNKEVIASVSGTALYLFRKF